MDRNDSRWSSDHHEEHCIQLLYFLPFLYQHTLGYLVKFVWISRTNGSYTNYLHADRGRMNQLTSFHTRKFLILLFPFRCLHYLWSQEYGFSWWLHLFFSLGFAFSLSHKLIWTSRLFILVYWWNITPRKHL